MKKVAVMILLMGLSSIASASIVSIGHYKVIAEGFELTTNRGGGSVKNSDVEDFLGVTGLDGFEGSAAKDSFNITTGQVFSFDWVFSTSDTYYNDFSFINLQLDGNTIFSKEILRQASNGNGSGHFSWAATGTGLLSYGIGILDMTDWRADSSIVISNINPVPLPAAAWLFLTGLFGLLGFKRSRYS